MSEGFGKVKVVVAKDGIDQILKDYKKIKKYMKSSLYQVKKIDGTEKVVSELLEEYYEDPI
jgi:hypothetical protein